MLIYRRTSIMESTAQTLVNTVNCVGVMGKGIAKEFKEREPNMFKAYRSICDRKLLAPGKLWLWQGSQNWVLNFPTKIHWRNPSKIEWIEAGLEKFVAEYTGRGIKSISFPRLGCGNGGLDWSDVQPVMVRHLQGLPIPVFIHDYTVDIGLPEHLEAVSKQLEAECPPPATFDAFLLSLKRAAELGGRDLVDIANKTSFGATMDANNNLTIETSEASWRVEEDDLRGVWVSLLNGLVTRDKAGWAVRPGGDAVLSMLSVLPHVRAIQIQRPLREAEVAVELRPTTKLRSSPVPEFDERLEHTWA
jgi:O-acetyl-ADP-ribose deacetylase (regulator of RNase III)